MGSKREDPAMAKVRSLFAGSGLTLDELGRRMGYPAATARQSAWQFMRSGDPRISMLRRFARAMGMPVEELVAEGTEERPRSGR
jgi:transcriptional regulator with XRE-family HTH domain